MKTDSTEKAEKTELEKLIEDYAKDRETVPPLAECPVLVVHAPPSGGPSGHECEVVTADGVQHRAENFRTALRWARDNGKDCDVVRLRDGKRVRFSRYAPSASRPVVEDTEPFSLCLDAIIDTIAWRTARPQLEWSEL
jgi:hypothetical protein